MERITIDPVFDGFTADFTREPLDLVWFGDDNALALLDHQYPAPTPDIQWASAPDQDGESPVGATYKNRQIAVALEALAIPTTPAGTNMFTVPRCNSSSGWTAPGTSTATVSVYGVGTASPPADEINVDSYINLTAGGGGSVTPYTTAPFGVTTGHTYTFSAYLRATTADAFTLKVMNSSGTVKATSAQSTSSADGAWVRLSVTFTVDTGGIWRFGVNLPANLASCGITGMQLEETSEATTYFDTLTPGCYPHPSYTYPVRPTGPERVRRMVDQITKKLAKVTEKGGVYRRIFLDGTVRYYDLLSSDQASATNDAPYYWANVSTVQAQLTAKPFWRGVETLLNSYTETNLPVLTGGGSPVPSEVPALGRAVFTNPQAADQAWVSVGVHGDYSTAATAKDFYEAEACTPLGAAATSTTPTGGSGSSSNVVKHASLSSAYQAFLSSQASGGGDHWTHEGTFNVWARVQGVGTGDISVGLEWSTGDFRRTIRQGEQELPANGQWYLVNLGQVTIPTNASRWEARLIAKSTVNGDDIAADYWWIQPTDVWFSAAASSADGQAPTEYKGLAADGTDGYGTANLTGTAAPIGGNWTVTPIGSGHPDADDFKTTSGSALIYRDANGDANTGYNYGRMVYLPTNSMTVTAVQCGLITAADGWIDAQGIMARCVDRDNFLAAYYNNQAGKLSVIKVVAGTTTYLGGYSTGNVGNTSGLTIGIRVYVDGTWALYYLPGHPGSGSDAWAIPAGSGKKVASGQDSALATGGALAAGYAGLYDWSLTCPVSRFWTNFYAWVPPVDAAVFASRELVVDHAKAEREDSSGTFRNDVSSFVGDRFLLPPNVPLRFSAKSCRADPMLGGVDAAIDDMALDVYYSPRGIL